MPRGESDADRRAALLAMGVEPVDQLPDLKRQALLPKLRQEGEVTGALWAMDGGELSYPKDGQGPQGWGVQLWRERKLLQKEPQNAIDGKPGSTLPDFSDLGVGARVANDQLAIQDANLKTPSDLADYRKYPNHVYDDGTLKPASEMAHLVSCWREMYAHGTLEVPDEPITQFGRVAGGGDGGGLSQSIRSWYRRNQKQPQVASMQATREAHDRRRAEEQVSAISNDETRDRKRFKSGIKGSRRRQSVRRAQKAHYS